MLGRWLRVLQFNRPNDRCCSCFFFNMRISYSLNITPLLLWHYHYTRGVLKETKFNSGTRKYSCSLFFMWRTTLVCPNFNSVLIISADDVRVWTGKYISFFHVDGFTYRRTIFDAGLHHLYKSKRLLVSNWRYTEMLIGYIYLDYKLNYRQCVYKIVEYYVKCRPYLVDTWHTYKRMHPLGCTSDFMVYQFYGLLM